MPRLTVREVQEMAGACLDADPETAAAATRLLAHCDGLPFAVEEILAAAAASGELEHRPDGWHVHEGIRTDTPDSIVGSVQNRLAALEPKVAEVIVAAAVLGRQFDWTLLPAICDATDAEVIAALAQARNVQLIEPHEQGHGWLRFRHSLTRAAIISGCCRLTWRGGRRPRPTQYRRLTPACQAPGVSWPLSCTRRPGSTRRRHGCCSRLGGATSSTARSRSAAETLGEARAQLGHLQDADPTLAADVDESLVKALALAGDNSRLAPIAEEAVARLECHGIRAEASSQDLADGGSHRVRGRSGLCGCPSAGCQGDRGPARQPHHL